MVFFNSPTATYEGGKKDEQAFLFYFNEKYIYSQMKHIHGLLIVLSSLGNTDHLTKKIQ